MDYNKNNLSNKYLILILLAVVLFNFSIHIPFLMVNSFGEQDAARLVNNSLYASYHGNEKHYPNPEPVYSAPLYVETLRLGIISGLLTPDNIIFWMTITSLLASTVTTIMLFIFVFIITGSILAAVGLSLILQFNPTFWLNSIYGFPTIVAISFLLISVVLFTIILENHQMGVLLFIAVIFFFLSAVLIKIDIIFVAPIFCIPVWHFIAPPRKKLFLIGIILLVTLMTLFAYIILLNSLSTSDTSFSFYSKWNQKFPLEWKYLFSDINIRTVVKAVGLLIIPTTIIASYLIIKFSNFKSTLFWLIIAILPLIFFWGMRSGNSARHNLIPIILIYIIISIPLASRFWIPWTIILVLVVIYNYQIFPAEANSVIPSGRLISSSLFLKEFNSNLHNQGRFISGLPNKKIAVVGNGPFHPYYLFELYSNKNISSVKIYFDSKIGYTKIHVTSSLEEQDTIWLYTNPTTDKLIELTNLGYYLVITNPSLKSELLNFPELSDRWIDIINRE